jgi:hypothetical protein
VIGRGFEDVKQGGDEGIDSAAKVLEIDQENVEALHRLGRRPAYLSIEAEDRDLVQRIREVVAFDHIVLLVTAKTMLRAEGGGKPKVFAPGKCIQRMDEVRRDRSRVRKQCDPAALKRSAQASVVDEAVDTEFHDRPAGGSRSTKQSG